MANINVACNSGNGVQLNTKDTICKNNIVVKPRAASGLTLAATDNTTDVTVGSTASSGKFNVTASITGKMTASTPGWFSSGSATDSSVIVGKIAASTIGTPTSLSGLTANQELSPGTEVVISKGYYASDRRIRAKASTSSKTFYVMPNAKYNIVPTSTTSDWVLHINNAAARLRVESLVESLVDSDDMVSSQFISLTDTQGLQNQDGEFMHYIGYYGYGESGGEIYFASVADPEGDMYTETILSWTKNGDSEVSYAWGNTGYISDIHFAASGLSEDEYQLIAALYGSAY